MDDAFDRLGEEDDAWAFVGEGPRLTELVRSLVRPFRGDAVSKVVGVEARGFALGAAAALSLGAGFVPIRKGDAYLPGPILSVLTEPDWNGVRHAFRLQTPALGPLDRVLLVDDWTETGAQLSAAVELVESTGATLVGATVVVDEMPAGSRLRSSRFHAVRRRP